MAKAGFLASWGSIGGRGKVLLGIGLFLLSILIYYPGLEANLVADDFRLVGRLSFTDALRSLHDTVGFGRNEYRPLVALSFAVSNGLWGGDPKGYHLESIFLHAVNVVLFFSWLLLLVRSVTISGMAALLFAVHPIHHARVVWIAARDSLLSTFFVLVAIILYTLIRRRNDPDGSQRIRASGILFALSLGLCILGMLSYEGAVVFPGIVAGLELFVFTRRGENAWSRLRTAVTKALPYAIILVCYLVFWTLLFRGEVGQYELSFSLGNLWRNYCSLLYQLFYGHEHLAGVLYFILLLLALLLPRDRLPLVWFSVLWMFVSFLPFVMIAGFASRFAYASAVGYSLLIALILSACTLKKRTGSMHAVRSLPLQASIMIFVTLLVYYSIDLRARIAEWRTAGEIADAIPRHVKACYPDLPDGSTVVLAGIPRMFGHAYVYPLGLEAAIERSYPGRRLQVFYGPGPMEEIKAGKAIHNPNAFYFQYRPDRGGVEDISAMQK
jgi:hypothetical protein